MNNEGFGKRSKWQLWPGMGGNFQAEWRQFCSGLCTTGKSAVGSDITSDLTITAIEESEILAAIQECNAVLDDLATELDLVLVDIHKLMDPAAQNAFGGYSEEYYLHISQDNDSFFSLDGLHPSDLGYALIANKFINAINAEWDLELDLLDTEDFLGQY